ncbi:hypothetical protein IGI04_001016 [Brassica rapa subsp. trilocularis]|uniref:Uncharacterized protein n=2 Tax=Brassica campestris TaxID=3711 RepID=M4DA78_BRACM|nr:hypothetical protein IGI04_001016 [Brassica rapa subsp. trilocularis]
METESSQYALALSSSSSSLPPHYQNPESCIGSFINLASSYRSFLRHLNPHGLALGLQNVICYGTDNKNDNGVPPYVVFKKTQIKKIIVTLPSSFKHYGYGCLAREATLSKRSSHATSPPLPFIFSSCNHNGAKRRQKAPLLISNGELNIPQDTPHSDASSVNGSPSEVLQIALPQYSGSDLCDPWYMPCGEHINHQAPPTYAASSELVFASQSFFANFGPIPISYPPIDEGLDLEELTNNFKQYELWGGPQENNNLDDVNTIDGSSYVISRSPFDPIGRPCNPFGPIERPLPHLPSSCELADLGFV